MIEASTKATKVKLLRAINFPTVLDVYDYCSDSLKTELNVGKKEEIRIREEETKAMLDKTEKEQPMEEEKMPKREKKALTEGTVITPDSVIYAPQGTGMQTGKYHLIGAITHKGLSSDGGHYMSWIHFHDNEWARIDDEIVGPVDTEEIHKLAGGRDCDMAYMLLYRRIEMMKPK